MLWVAAGAAEDTRLGLQSQRPVVNVPPMALDWRKVKLPSLEVTRSSLPGGGSLVVFPGATERRFQLMFVFPSGIYTVPRDQAPAMEAAASLLLLGGGGKHGYESIVNMGKEEGIGFESGIISATGNAYLSVQGLASGLPAALRIAEELLLSPRFEEKALELWKQQRADDFEGSLDVSGLSGQIDLVNQQLDRLLLGDDHYETQRFLRRSRKAVQRISRASVVNASLKLLSPAGILVVLAGHVGDAPAKVRRITEKLHDRDPSPKVWYPGRPLVAPSKTMSLVTVQKPDMRQATLVLRYGFPRAGELNPKERVQWSIAQEVFSSKVGVIGTDRISKALRGDSGISYFARSSPEIFGHACPAIQRRRKEGAK